MIVQCWEHKEMINCLQIIFKQIQTGHHHQKVVCGVKSQLWLSSRSHVFFEKVHGISRDGMVGAEGSYEYFG